MGKQDEVRRKGVSFMPEVTVVIPNLNGMKYIGGCLESLGRLEEADLFRVLVVDNGSTDGSAELVAERYPQAGLVRLPENTGFCHAVNVGIQASKTPYVILLNNDTEVLPGFVLALYRAMEKNRRAFAISSLMLRWEEPDLIDDAGDGYCVLGWAFARGKGRPAADYDRPVKVFAACGGAAIYRRSVFEEIGLFDEAHFAYLEDIDICYRARIYGYESWYEPQAKVRHAGSASSGSRYNSFKTSLASANSVYLIGKNMPLLQWLWNLPFLLTGFAIKTCFFTCKKMGMLYLKGLCRGLGRLFSEEGRSRRVKFGWKRLPNYLAIQGQLYLNVFRLLFNRTNF